MELHQLRYMVALSREKNFQRAAKRVHISQPTLSHQIKKLETELGAPLFERSSQGVKLTPAGEKFLPYATQALDGLEQGVAEIREDIEDICGKVSIGAIPTIAPYLIPEVLVRVRKEAPQLSIELYEETTTELLDSLKFGKIDLGIMALPVVDPGLVSRSLGQENFFLATSRDHPLAQKKQVTPKMLQNEKLLILQEGHCFSDQALEYCERRRNDDQIIFQGSSLSSVMKLASVGEGLTLVPKMAVNSQENPKLKFIPFRAPQPKREVGIVWRVSVPLTLAHRYVMKSIENSFRTVEK